MHSLVRRFLKTGIAFLATGLLLGLWLLAKRELGLGAISARELSAHTHALLVGFVLMMICGVALWIFPRPASDDTRYRPVLVEAAWWGIAVGTGLRVVLEALAPAVPAAWYRMTIFAAGVSQFAGLLLFFWTMWSRIRAVGSAVREAKGEKF